MILQGSRLLYYLITSNLYLYINYEGGSIPLRSVLTDEIEL